MSCVAVLGAGGFGRAIANVAARSGQTVLLWSRQPRSAEHPNIRPIVDLADIAPASLVFVAVPSAWAAKLAREAGQVLDGSHFLVHVSRGLLGDELGTLTQQLRAVTPCRRVGVLAGPLVAHALNAGEPSGGIVGSLFPEVVEVVRDAIGGPTLRIYSTMDVTGVEVASAMVGLLALGIGYARGSGFGPGTAAVIATRGMAEAARVGVMLGGQERTFSGLAGFGDLIAAVAGDNRPETLFGQALAEGLPLVEAASKAGAFVEGAEIAARVSLYGERHGVEVPISTALAALISGQAQGSQLLANLMARPIHRE